MAPTPNDLVAPASGYTQPQLAQCVLLVALRGLGQPEQIAGMPRHLRRAVELGASSGGALFDGERLLCLLEGAPLALAVLRRMLAQGPPVADLLMLFEAPVAARQCSDWQLGYVEPGSLAGGLRQLLRSLPAAEVKRLQVQRAGVGMAEALAAALEDAAGHADDAGSAQGPSAGADAGAKPASPELPVSGAAPATPATPGSEPAAAAAGHHAPVALMLALLAAAGRA